MSAAPVRVIYPQEGPQEAVLRSPADIVLHGGARGGAKSYTLLLRALRWVSTPGYGAVLFRESEAELWADGGLVEKSREIYPHAGGRFWESELRWEFPNGATITLAGFGTNRGMSKWLGQQIAFVGIDEAASWKEPWVWLLLSSNRSTCGIRPRMHLTCNPDPDSWLRPFVDWWLLAKGHPQAGFPNPGRAGRMRWFARIKGEIVWRDTRRQLENDHPGCSPLSVEFHPALVEDNPALLKKDRTYLAKLENLPEVERARFKLGNWDVRHSAGLVFRSSWFPMVTEGPGAARRVRSWDLAWTPTGAWTVGILEAQTATGWWIEDMIALRGFPNSTRWAIEETARLDGKGVTVRLPADGASSHEIDKIVVALGGVAPVHVAKEKGTIEARSVDLRTQAERGLIRLCATHPTRRVSQQLAQEGVETSTATDWRPVLQAALDRFPAKSDDHVSALTGGFEALAEVGTPISEAAMEAVIAANPLLVDRQMTQGRFDAAPGRAMSAGRFRL